MRYPEAPKEQLKAPKDKFRVIGVNLEQAVAGANYHVGDCETLDAAKQIAKERAGVGSPMYVYDDRGELIVRYGSWH